MFIKEDLDTLIDDKHRATTINWSKRLCNYNKNGYKILMHCNSEHIAEVTQRLS